MSDITTKQALPALRKEAFQINSKITDVEARKHLDPLLAFHQSKPKGTKKTKGASTEQGNLMEAVVHYFLSQCGFLEDASNTDRNRKYQIDHHAIFNEASTEQLKKLYEITRKPHFIAESKNYRTDELDVDKVHKLVGITNLLGYQISAFFSWTAMNGNEYTAANGLVADYAGKDNIKSILLLFYQKDFEFLYKYPKLFGYLFYEKLRVFDTTKMSHDIDYNRILESQALYTP
jgi:hypothetical protein